MCENSLLEGVPIKASSIQSMRSPSSATALMKVQMLMMTDTFAHMGAIALGGAMFFGGACETLSYVAGFWDDCSTWRST